MKIFPLEALANFAVGAAVVVKVQNAVATFNDSIESRRLSNVVSSAANHQTYGMFGTTLACFHGG